MAEERGLEWSDGIGNRRRERWLVLIKDDRVHHFCGETIPGVAVVVGHGYTKNGKWSANHYRMKLAPGVRAIAGYEGWETGRFVEGLRKAVGFPRPIDRWIDVAEALRVTIPAAQEYVRAHWPGDAKRLDRVEEELMAIEETEENADVEIVAVNFGGPTNRQIGAGFWEMPVVVRDHDGRVAAYISPGGRYKEWQLDLLEIDGDTDAVKVLSVVHSRGYHGGHVSMRVAVPAGYTAEHLDPELS
ncbi:MAG: hypothetical protein DRO14_00660 [Thermoprotei archaeon]|nr:MAG: hypothetical protein DRO14_00660 [Thermoprotei archaeon]